MRRVAVLVLMLAAPALDKEEQRRFEILLGHWDVPMAPVDLEQAP